MNTIAKKLCFTALLSALCCLCTWLLAVPFPGGVGYFNVGDIFVLISAWLLGPLYGTIAAGIGSMLADVFAGYTVYAPATLLIKGATALTAYYVFALLCKLIKKEKVKPFLSIPAALLAELVMVLGYLLFESTALGLGVGAFASVPGNALQGLCGSVGGFLLFFTMQKIPSVKRLFQL